MKSYSLYKNAQDELVFSPTLFSPGNDTQKLGAAYRSVPNDGVHTILLASNVVMVPSNFDCKAKFGSFLFFLTIRAQIM